MVPHIGSEESAGLAGSGGDWGVCVDAPVVVGRCAVGPPPLRRFFRAEGVAKKCLRSAHGWESGVESLMEPQIGIRGRASDLAAVSYTVTIGFQWSPR